MSTADFTPHFSDQALIVRPTDEIPSRGTPRLRRRAGDVLVLDPPPMRPGEDEKVVICLPTYNESPNVARMLHALAETVGRGVRIIVIDDGSPDGTADMAEGVGAEVGCVEVIRRRHKDGLGRAYAVGFERALETDADLVVQMDCDFSHDPTDVLRLISASHQADLVLGSRYVQGGALLNWPRRRRLLSRGGSMYAATILGLGVRDLTGGFKCWRRRALEAVGLDALRTSGYGFQIETTYRAAQQGWQIAEIPITFTERIAGVSKMAPGIALEAVMEVPRLRFARQGLRPASVR